MESGEKVRLRSYEGEIERIVVRVADSIVLVCREEEYKQAAKEKRQPVVVGFPLNTVLGTVR